ncbi:PEP-CTERM sorting domain-containing protein [Colwellia sp. MB02u-10]|uniref:PEP-CTERM sorting domain-containing protein n=1 Tax=Colwellia sp. MB02u-10 TaxID=2759828 RepID=UPI0015F71325|nr:PEP-CTERM sorting domain-containing protein [Colwellia sp. MB02u-10]MBA6341483.1 PEP-CTERM sorting domain-containing protein [Colwellia sp. MB02u-10]
MLNLTKKILMTLVLTLGMASYSYADIVLDDFDYTPDPQINLEVNASNTSDSTQRNNVNVLGADVVYDLEYISGDLDSSAVTFGAGNLALSNDVLMKSSLLLTYSELVAPGAPIADFSALNGFYFDLLNSDLGFSILVTIGSDSGANTSTSSTVSGAIASLTRTNILFSSFMTGLGTGANFAAVDYVSVLITSELDSVDLLLTEFGATNVPEPTSLAIFGLGLIGLAFSARKKV